MIAPASLLDQDWDGAAATFRQRFMEAIGREDFADAEEAFLSGLISETLADAQRDER